MAHEGELMKGNLPMLILAVLQDGSLHGYAIAREIEQRSEKELRVNEGALYPALKTLEQQGLIGGEWEKPLGARARKVYRITPSGQTVLERHCHTWTRFSKAIERVITGESDGRGTDPPGHAPHRRSTGPLPEPSSG